MACGGCNTTKGLTKGQIEMLIQNKIDSGKLQGGLKTCDGTDLPAKARILLCSELIKKVNDALANGEIKAVKDVVFKEGTMIVTDGTGRDFTYKLPYPVMAIGDKEVVFTQPDGKTVSVPKADNLFTADMFDKTIAKGVNETDKFGVKTGDGIVVKQDGSLAIGEVFTKKPIKGKGTKADPISISLNDRDFTVNDATGEISLKAYRSQAVTNLNNGVNVLGYSTFFGNVDKARGVYVIGVPPSINSEDPRQNATAVVDELKDGESYDFNGWQISSPVQVDQYLVGTDNAVWHRVNDYGMNPDGSFKNPEGWTVWHRETNVQVSMVQVEALQKRVDNLEGRVAALEKLLAGFVPLKDASGTEQLGLIKP